MKTKKGKPRISAAHVRRIRKRLQLTQQAFADKLDVSRETVKSWENGRSRASGPAAILIRQMV